MCDFDELEGLPDGSVLKVGQTVIVKAGAMFRDARSGDPCSLYELVGEYVILFRPDEPSNPRFIEWWVDGVGITRVSWDDAARGYPRARTDAARWERTAQQHERKVWELQRELIRIRFDEGGNV